MNGSALSAPHVGIGVSAAVAGRSPISVSAVPARAARSPVPIEAYCSTALRLLRTLETTGFVRRDDARTYRPGSRVIQLGAQALSDESLVDLSRPAMEELATETGESVYLSVEGHAATAVYISIVEGTHSVRHASWVGRTVGLDTSAAGQALRGKVSEDGYVVVERGVESDVTAIACPVRSQDRITAAMSLVVPSYRLTARLTTRYGRRLAAATADVSAQLSSSR